MTGGDALMNDEILDYEISSTFGKGSDSAGHDGISTKLIDSADRTVMHDCLKVLWNKAWCNGCFARDCKMENRIIIPCFFHFSDAFGSVNRTRLLHKIGKDFGITGRLFLHIQSFLSERCARLKINMIFGDWFDSNDGTSAGRKLGPLLFIMYIHDVPKYIAPKFADDLVSVAVENDVESVKEQL